MDKKLQMLERLYESNGEPLTDGELADDAAGAEAKEIRLMSEAKYVLDRRPGLRPEQETIDAIVRRAASAAGAGTDAAPSPRPLKIARIIPLHWQAAVAAAFVFVAVGLVFWQVARGPALDPANPLAQPAEVLAESDGAAADVRERRDADAIGTDAFGTDAFGTDAFGTAPQRTLAADDEVAAMTAPTGEVAEMEPESESRLAKSLADGREGSLSGSLAGGRAASPAAAMNDSIPSWDDSADLRLVQKRIEMLRRSGNDLDWGTPAVPLEQLPASGARPGIRAAGASGNNN